MAGPRDTNRRKTLAKSPPSFRKPKKTRSFAGCLKWFFDINQQNNFNQPFGPQRPPETKSIPPKDENEAEAPSETKVTISESKSPDPIKYRVNNFQSRGVAAKTFGVSWGPRVCGFEDKKVKATSMVRPEWVVGENKEVTYKDAIGGNNLRLCNCFSCVAFCVQYPIGVFKGQCDDAKVSPEYSRLTPPESSLAWKCGKGCIDMCCCIPKRASTCVNYTFGNSLNCCILDPVGYACNSNPSKVHPIEDENGVAPRRQVMEDGLDENGLSLQGLPKNLYVARNHPPLCVACCLSCFALCTPAPSVMADPLTETKLEPTIAFVPQTASVEPVITIAPVATTESIVATADSSDPAPNTVLKILIPSPRPSPSLLPSNNAPLVSPLSSLISIRRESDLPKTAASTALLGASTRATLGGNIGDNNEVSRITIPTPISRAHAGPLPSLLSDIRVIDKPAVEPGNQGTSVSPSQRLYLFSGSIPKERLDSTPNETVLLHN